MNTTQKRLRNTILIVGSLIIGFFAVQLILSHMQQAPAFDYANFATQLDVYKSSDSNFSENQKAVQEYINKIKTQESSSDENTSIYDVLPQATGNTAFVTSNDEQIRMMASEALAVAQEFYGIEDVKFLDAVYAVEERVAIYSEMPRTYLFFAFTPDESKMVAIAVTPTESGYSIETQWTIDQAGDTKYVENETNRLLFIYSNKVF